jgi:hypothetical protein
MSELKIQPGGGRRAFEPGEELAGAASWKLDKPPHSLELRLFWFTRGHGEADAGVVETVRFDHALAEEARPFRFRLPDGPYSFSGKVISLVWALELVAQPSKETGRQEIILAPGGKEVRLGSLPETKAKKRLFPWGRR